MRKQGISNKLYWKLAATFSLVLIVLGISYVYISSYSAHRYFQEVNQRLYGGIAAHLVKETHPLVDGKPDTAATHDIMHSMMVINPSAEVYLLDPEGNIIDFVVPYKTVRLDAVNLAPVKQFIEEEAESYILGDDPKNPGEQKVFSAAPIIEDGVTTGYAYIILASEEQEAVTSTLAGSYMLKLGRNIFFLTLAVALIIGMIAIWLITKNLRSIIQTVRRFKEGDYQARVEGQAKTDLSIFVRNL